MSFSPYCVAYLYREAAGSVVDNNPNTASRPPVLEIRSIFECFQRLTQESTLKYEPLKRADSIRLLTLHPGEFSTPIRMDLDEYQLENTPQYEALSYCWGDLTKRVCMPCNGGFLNITVNLATALLYLRSRTTPRLLWIDAICIDQDNLSEKSSQVSIMVKIYSNSFRVVVWLGEETNDTDIALEAVVKITEHFHLDKWDCTEFIDPRKSNHPALGLNPKSWNVLGLNEKHRMALVRLFSRAWFSRAWVLQEVSSWALGSSPIVMIGWKTLPWKDLSDSYAWLGIKQIRWLFDDMNKEVGKDRHGILCISSRKITRDRQRGILKVSFLELLRSHIFMKSSDPRDMIYSLTGLADAPGAQRARQTQILYNLSSFSLHEDLYGLTLTCSVHAAAQRVWSYYLLMFPPAPPVATRYLPERGQVCNFETPLIQLQPNYAQPCAQLFEDASRMIIADELSLNILLFVINRNSDIRMDLPSWVPDWSNLDASNAVQYEIGTQFSAAAHTPAWIDPFPQSGLLEVGAIFCDRVARVSDSPMDIGYKFLILKQWKEMVQQMDHYPTGESVFDAYWRALVINRHVGKSFSRKLPPDSFRLHFKAAWVQMCELKQSRPSCDSRWERSDPTESWVSSIRDLPGDISHDTWSDEADEDQFWQALSCWSTGRRFFTCENGWMGVGPIETRPGDYVTILKGGSLPFILRPQDANSVSIDSIATINKLMQIPGRQRLEFDADHEDFFPEHAFHGFFEARSSGVKEFLEKESLDGDKKDQARFSLVGCSYVHGISDGQVMAHVESLYSRDYLFKIGTSWTKIFLK